MVAESITERKGLPKGFAVELWPVRNCSVQSTGVNQIEVVRRIDPILRRIINHELQVRGDEAWLDGRQIRTDDFGRGVFIREITNHSVGQNAASHPGCLDTYMAQIPVPVPMSSALWVHCKHNTGRLIRMMSLKLAQHT